MDKKKIAELLLLAGAAGAVHAWGKKRRNVTYSKIDEIPTGRPKGSLSAGCLVVEGGSLRGMYAGGVLDAFMKNNILFDNVIGTSAGALFGYMYVSGQIGRGARFNLKNRFNPEYVGVQALLENGSPFGFKYAFDNANTPEEPIDTEAFENSPQHFVATATDCETGKTAFFEKGTGFDMLSCVRASATLPMVSTMAIVNGRKYLDGGCNDAIPFDWALKKGFDKIIVVRTRERTYRKDENMSDVEKRLIERRYDGYPELINDLLTSDRKYNESCRELISLEKKKRIFTIAPSVSPNVGRLEANLEKLGRLYWLGYHDGEAAIPELKRYLYENT